MHPIRDYFLIGDLHTAALVSARGSIDWLCVPTFESPSVFAAILDEKKGGTFSVEAQEYSASAAYVPNTAIVETVFTRKESAFSVRDFMVPRPTEDIASHFLVRKVTGQRGTSVVTFHLEVRPAYGRQALSFQKSGKRVFAAHINQQHVWLVLPAAAEVHHSTDGIMKIELELSEGQSEQLIFEFSSQLYTDLNWQSLEEQTVLFWQDWIAQGTFFDFCCEGLTRSAITLKLMQFYPTGGLIAAPTTSLPETIGGERNWDYRYVWLRDATLTLYAFYILGYKDEARRFFHFLENVCDGIRECEDDQCQVDIAIMYTIWGQQLQQEEILDHLEGYKGSRPVRIGNDASHQHQLDIYGSLIDAYYFMSKRGVEITKRGRDVIHLFVRKIEEHWQRTENGIWEVRDFTQHFTYGKVMAWVGVDRALRMADLLELSDEKRQRWEQLRDDIHDWIWEHCYDEERGAFRQHSETSAQDATNLLLVPLQFLDRHEERSWRVIEETRRELSAGEFHVYRYRNEDGFEGDEGAFVLCTYWLIASLAAVGKADEAQQYFDRFDKCMSRSHLLSEEIDPETCAYLGNFPQAFSHIGYIFAAYYLHRYGQQKNGGKID